MFNFKILPDIAYDVGRFEKIQKALSAQKPNEILERICAQAVFRNDVKYEMPEQDDTESDPFTAKSERARNSNKLLTLLNERRRIMWKGRATGKKLRDDGSSHIPKHVRHVVFIYGPAYLTAKNHRHCCRRASVQHIHSFNTHTQDMKNAREGFIFYRSFFEAIDSINEEEQLPIYRAIMKYGLDMKVPQLKGIGNSIWMLIKPQLDANWRRYVSGCKGKSDGKKGGNPNFAKGKRNPYYPLSSHPEDNSGITPMISPEITPKRKEKEEENIKENMNGKEEAVRADKSTRFVPPTLAEVRDFISKEGYGVDPARFVDFYESKGWMVGSNRMKDWKAAVRSWQHKEGRKPEEIGLVLKENSNNKFQKQITW